MGLKLNLFVQSCKCCFAGHSTPNGSKQKKAARRKSCVSFGREHQVRLFDKNDETPHEDYIATKLNDSMSSSPKPVNEEIKVVVVAAASPQQPAMAPAPALVFGSPNMGSSPIAAASNSNMHAMQPASSPPAALAPAMPEERHGTPNSQSTDGRSVLTEMPHFSAALSIAVSSSRNENEQFFSPRQDAAP